MDESGNLVPLRLAALQLANDVRRARSELKRQIADGVVLLPDVLLAPPPVATGIPLETLLGCQRGWGLVKSQRFLSANHVNEARTLGELSERQRELLAERLRSLSARDGRSLAGDQSMPPA